MKIYFLIIFLIKREQIKLDKKEFLFHLLGEVLMIIFSLWQEVNPPCRNERKESHHEKFPVISKQKSVPCHIEMRRTNPPPIHNQSICFHLKMTIIRRLTKWLSFIISARCVIAIIPVRKRGIVFLLFGSKSSGFSFLFLSPIFSESFSKTYFPFRIYDR